MSKDNHRDNYTEQKILFFANHVNKNSEMYISSSGKSGIWLLTNMETGLEKEVSAKQILTWKSMKWDVARDEMETFIEKRSEQ